MAEDLNLETPSADAPAESSLHDDISAAIEQVETRDAPPAGDSIKATPPPLPETPAGDRARGPDGRFQAAPKAPEKAQDAPVKPAPAADPKQALAAPPKAPGAPAAAPAPPKEPAAPASRPPVAWKASAREQWTKLPADVQAEVTRRENEVGRVMQESAKAREALSHVQRVIGPYAQNIAASGHDAVSFIETLAKADNTLRHGSIADKATFMAGLIKSYGVDIQALDQVLAGQAVAPDPNAALADQLRREMQAQLKPVLGYFNHMQGQRQNAMAQIQSSAQGDVQAFAEDAAHEFFEDVREDMADIMDLYTARGASISLQDAYDRAIKLNPQVSEIVSKRAEAERVNAAAQAAQRARKAATSIGGSGAPAGIPGPANDDRRSVIEAAWDAGNS